MTERELYLRARDIILQRGWCQGAFINAQGCVCLSEAFIQAKGGQFVPSPRFQEIIGGELFITYNDTPGRTVEQVITALEAAAN